MELIIPSTFKFLRNMVRYNVHLRSMKSIHIKKTISSLTSHSRININKPSKIQILTLIISVNLFVHIRDFLTKSYSVWLRGWTLIELRMMLFFITTVADIVKLCTRPGKAKCSKIKRDYSSSWNWFSENLIKRKSRENISIFNIL